MTVQFKVPEKSELVDKQFFQVPGPDGILTGYQFDAETCTLWAKESQIIIPSLHGITHISEDPVPIATTDTQGHLSADDKVKLDTLVQTRFGILGFQGAGFPDDGGFLEGDIILAAGSEFISLERIGNTIRFTVDSPVPLNCACEECAQIFWIQDESEPSAIRPPSCNGTLPGVNSYGEVKIYLLPEGSILDPSNPTALLNTKGQFPSFIFKRYDDGITPNEAEMEAVLKRNSDLTTHTGWAMTPGPLGVVETVWFTGKDDEGRQLRFDLEPRSEPGLLGALLYNGHTITRRMAIVTNFTPQVLSTNQYLVKFWDILDAETIGDEFTATNIWRFENFDNSSSDPVDPKRNVLDATKSLLPVGTLVQLWEFEIGQTGGQKIIRAFFNKEPDLPATAFWNMGASVTFGDILTRADEPTAAGTLLTADDLTSEGQRIFEKTIWGLTNFEDRFIISDDGTFDSSTGIYNPSGIPLNNQIVADIDTSVPGLVITEAPQIIVGDINGDGVVDDEDLQLLSDSFGRSLGDPLYNPDADINDDGIVDVKDLNLVGLGFNISAGDTHSRPVFFWHRGNHKNLLLTAKIGMPDATNSQDFPPYDILLRAPVDSFDDTYVKVIKRGTFTKSPFTGSPFIVVKGIHWDDLPSSGCLRILTGAWRNTLWRFTFKAAFSQFDDDGITLIGTDEEFPFDEDFPLGTGTGADFTSGTSEFPANTTVSELLHADFTSPCVRLEFSVNDTTDAESVQLQVKVGTLDMTLPYELDRESTIEDDIIRGLQPGFAVSQILTQDAFISDGVGSGVTSDPEDFRVFTGGELPIPVNGNIEKWNDLQIMFRDSQLWVWWNGLIIPPSQEESAALPTPVVINTPYFPLESDLEFGKISFRLWPGATVRTAEIRDQAFVFTEFTNGQLEVVS